MTKLRPAGMTVARCCLGLGSSLLLVALLQCLPQTWPSVHMPQRSQLSTSDPISAAVPLARSSDSARVMSDHIARTAASPATYRTGDVTLQMRRGPVVRLISQPSTRSSLSTESSPGVLVASNLETKTPSTKTAASTASSTLDNSSSPANAAAKAASPVDYDLVYVRVPRRAEEERAYWHDQLFPGLVDPGSDLVLLRADGREEVLVKGSVDSAVTDPVVSLDGKSIYYSYVQGLRGTSQYGKPPTRGADVFRIDLETRQITRLTQQTFLPNLGAAHWTLQFRAPAAGRTHLGYGILNLFPCPLPGGKIVFASNRHAFLNPKINWPALQLFVMDEDGSNIECISPMSIASVGQPTLLRDGRIAFSMQESQGMRSRQHWAIRAMRPDGTQWQTLFSAFGSQQMPIALQCLAPLSDGSLIVDDYFHRTDVHYTGFLRIPVSPGDQPILFGPAQALDSRNPDLRLPFAPRLPGQRYPFSPPGLTLLARTTTSGDKSSTAGSELFSAKTGKYTYPSAAPEQKLLVSWVPVPKHLQQSPPAAKRTGIYLMPLTGVEQPELALVPLKMDEAYVYKSPRAVVPYARIHQQAPPAPLTPLPNDGQVSPHLPAGTPFALIGSASLYKRESYPAGVVREKSVTGEWSQQLDPTGYQGLDPFNPQHPQLSSNWISQGADAGRYTNDDIHALRILLIEPTTDRNHGYLPGRLFRSHAQERLRILGEIPVRKFSGGVQPVDPDGNPDTSFLARIPADVAFTFQTLDKRGMVLNMAQTWHQLRPGEKRVNCGGCHAHSQPPTLFEKTWAGQPARGVFDLVAQTPLLTTKAADQSERQWDTSHETGLRFAPPGQTVEYHRHVKPILQRSCAACHTKDAAHPPGQLVLDDEQSFELPMSEIDVFQSNRKVPGTYFRLAADPLAKFGYKPINNVQQWRGLNASRYIRKFQSRRSLLIWKILGERTDGWSNDDFPTETEPGNSATLTWKGAKIPDTQTNRDRADLDYTGSPMPPPDAVAGTYKNQQGTTVHVAPLSAEDRLTLIRWIDLGCPIDLDYHPAKPEQRGLGWMGDDQRPTLTLQLPAVQSEGPLSVIRIGMHDAYTGLDLSSFSVTADFEVDGVAPGTNFAGYFKNKSPGIWEYRLKTPVESLKKARLTVLIKDSQGNLSRIDRVFSTGR